MTDTIANCPNCGAAVSYHYCAVCGQETALHVPSAGEFLHEFIGHYVALEGKLWQTLNLLVFKPGKLTADYLAGRRARYVAPLRLYLTLSLLFFALFKFANVELIHFDQPTAEEQRTATRFDPGNTRVHLFGYESDALTAKMQRYQRMDGAGKSRIIADAFYNYSPYALFALMPLFAGWLKLLYAGSRRRYGEHLLFALHSNAFAFLMLMIIAVVPWGPVKFLLGLWMVAYLPIAMQRVYGGGKWLTRLRWLMLIVLHLASVVAAIASALFLAIVK
jgi:hypothetical protein